MKKPVDDIPENEVVKRIKRIAREELTRDLLSGTAYRSLQDTTGEEAVYKNLKRLLDAYVDYRYNQNGATERTVKAAEQALREAHPEILRSEMSQLIGKVEKVADRIIDSGSYRESVEYAISEEQSQGAQKVAVAQQVRERMFPSKLPADHRARVALEKAEDKYVSLKDPHNIKSMRGAYKDRLVDFMAASRAYEGALLEPGAPERAYSIIDAVDTALGREVPQGRKHARVSNIPGGAMGHP